MSDNNQKPDAWGQNKNIPDSWGKNNKLPENWGKQSSNADSGTPSGGTKMTSSSSVENTANLSDKAKSGIGLLAGAAKKVGGAAKNAAGNAVEYAKSDDVKDKLIATKNKAKSIANGAGSSLADMKEKTGDAINENHVSKSELSDDNTSDEIIEDTLDTAIAEDSSIVDSFDNASIEDDEMSAEADTDYYVPDEADYEVYDTEQEEEYEYVEDDVAEMASSGSLKKNILIGAAVLAVGIGTIIGVGLIFKKGDKKPNSNDSSIETTAETSTAATSTVTTAETTTSKAQSSTTTVVTTSESDKTETTAAVTTTSTIERIDTTEAVKSAIIAHLDREYANEKSKEYYYFDRDAKYALYDVNNDGIDELFISYNTVATGVTDIYLYNNGSYKLADSFGEGGVQICLDEHYIITEQHGGATLTRIFNILDGRLVKIDELCNEFARYTHNGSYVSDSAYNQLLSEYQNKNLISISDNSNPVSSIVGMSSYQNQDNVTANNNPYIGYKNIENAPSDMVFYEGNAIKIGIVQTDSSTLNMRTGPGTNYDIILHLQKNENVEVLGENSEWAYIKWSVWGAGQNIDYYGYVSREFLDIGYG